MKKRIDPTGLVMVVVTVISFILLSPRWTFPLAAFVAPFLLIRQTDGRKFWPCLLMCWGILFAAGLVANFKVMPFPTILFVPMVLLMSLAAAIPYIIYGRLPRKDNSWLSTIYFPVLQVLYEYGSSFLGGGTWNSIAYTQIDNLLFVQLASLTGMWGLTFMLYWFASLLAFCFKHKWKFEVVRFPLGLYGSITVMILLYGLVRVNRLPVRNSEHVRVAGVTGMNLHLLLDIYEDAFQKTSDVDVSTLTQTSPELQELNKALALFIEDPFSERFITSQRALLEFQDSMFNIASREARAGAKIIAFSEALMFTFKPIETSLIQKGQKFAKEKNVTLLLTMASFIPGKITFGAKYVENKAILINPFGEVEYVFFKNKPVPVVEPSIAGNGEVPVYNSVYGRLATSICYDADFPALIRKAGKQKAGILLLPSGDWKEISPYHANMSRMRAIENGLSILRPVSNAESIACDFTGRILAKRDFFDDGDKVVTTYLPINGTATLYSTAGDFFPWLSLLVGIAVLRNTRPRMSNKPASPVSQLM